MKIVAVVKVNSLVEKMHKEEKRQAGKLWKHKTSFETWEVQ